MSSHKLLLHFNNKTQTSEFVVPIRLHNNFFIKKWLVVLKNALDSNAEIKHGGIYFGSGIHSQSDIRETLIQCVNLINKDRPDTVDPIDLAFPELIDQEFLNLLHKDFERLYPLEAYKVGTHQYMRPTLELLNDSIHQYESTFGRKTNNFSIIVNFDSDLEINLDDEDYELFTPHRGYGEIYLNYATIGVPVLEAFKNDEEGMPTPQRTYRADFNLSFDPNYKFTQFNKLQSWLKTKFDLNINDRKLALGYISLGRMEEQGFSEQEIFENIRAHRALNRVELIVSRE